MNELSNQNKTRQRILDAAQESFQSLGYARTTTQKIAQKAGIAEVTLFRHFGNKEKLFHAIAQNIGGGPHLDSLEAILTYDLESDLRIFFKNALRFFLEQQDAIRMLLFESTHFPEMKTALAQNPKGMIELLDRYFKTQITAGKIQIINTQETAQAFMSMIFGYAIAMHHIEELLPSVISIEQTTNEMVRIFLAALKPSQH